MKTKCWNWKRAKGNYRYGCVWKNGRSHPVHRLTWIRRFGQIPKGLLVCHHCDNTLCFRPSHLFLGTQKENMLDASRKGRLSGLTKITEENIEFIYREMMKGVSFKKIAEVIRVHPSNISRLVAKRRQT